jgi:CBS domain-containing protein
MTPAVWAVCPDDPAMRAVDLMLEKGIHRVVVVSRPGTIAGIVTATDVLRALSRGGSFRDDDPAVEKAAAPAGPSQ